MTVTSTKVSEGNASRCCPYHGISPVDLLSSNQVLGATTTVASTIVSERLRLSIFCGAY